MRFIGCKKNLLLFIENLITQRDIRGEVFCDLFSGTASVGKHFKRLGYRIISTDILYFSYVLQRVYLQLNSYPKFSRLLKYLKIEHRKETLFDCENANAHEIVEYLNNLDGVNGFIYQNYSPEGTKGKKYIRKYFTGDNAQRIDAIREKIEKWKLKDIISDDEYFFLICAVIEAVPFVANISGTYAAFLKNWDKRALKKLELRVPEIISTNKKHDAYYKNGLELISNIRKVDILYLDPPYNARQYAPNYHLLETIARWDKPIIKGKTGMRGYSDQKSEFCNSASGLQALENILKSGNFKHLLLSYNDEGIIPENKILEIFRKYGKVEIFEQPYQRFKSNNGGKNLRNKVKEKLYHLKLISPKNKLNDLGGSEWLYFLNSVEVTHYSTNGNSGYAHFLRKQHPSPKPPQLMRKFIEFFTKEGDTVFDPFMGVGGVLLACSLSKRKGIGIDISKQYVDLYKQVCKELGLKKERAIVGNSTEVESLLTKRDKFDFILTDPPYGEMLSNKRTGEKKKKTGQAVSTPFTDDERDLGNMDREQFLSSLYTVINSSLKHLKQKGYLALFVKDMQPKDKEHNMLHCYITQRLLEIPNLSFRGYKIWYDATQKLYPFGYPHAFVSNQFHQFILIFRKER